MYVQIGRSIERWDVDIPVPVNDHRYINNCKDYLDISHLTLRNFASDEQLIFHWMKAMYLFISALNGCVSCCRDCTLRVCRLSSMGTILSFFIQFILYTISSWSLYLVSYFNHSSSCISWLICRIIWCSAICPSKCDASSWRSARGHNGILVTSGAAQLSLPLLRGGGCQWKRIHDQLWRRPTTD